ncbi:MAG: hypothetical protein V2I32_14470, partial [Desulforhopalus sp.]|nr:hypothetical protein [Desulforhopalus sp.]
MDVSVRLGRIAPWLLPGSELRWRGVAPPPADPTGVKKVDGFLRPCHQDLFSAAEVTSAGDSDEDRLIGAMEMEDRLSAQVIGRLDLGGHPLVGYGDCLRADTQPPCIRKLPEPVSCLPQRGGGEDIHRRVADESGDKGCRRNGVDLVRTAHLL